VTAASVVVAAGCAGLSAAQRTLSSPVRRLRRRAIAVRGEIELADGSREAIDAAALRAAPEGALRWLSAAVPLLAAGLLASRLG
jgi:predicted NAD/FAD-binding protein